MRQIQYSVTLNSIALLFKVMIHIQYSVTLQSIALLFTLELYCLKERDKIQYSLTLHNTV